MSLDLLEGKCLKYELVGSRITCDPAPTDTDQDVLVLADVDQWAAHLALSRVAAAALNAPRVLNRS